MRGEWRRNHQPRGTAALPCTATAVGNQNSSREMPTVSRTTHLGIRRRERVYLISRRAGQQPELSITHATRIRSSSLAPNSSRQLTACSYKVDFESSYKIFAACQLRAAFRKFGNLRWRLQA